MGVLCLLFTVLFFCSVLPAAAAADTVKLYGTEGPAPADGSSKMNANSYTLGIRFEVKDGKMVGFVLDDLFTDRAVKGVLRIYRWSGDYRTTTSAKPLVQKLIDVTKKEAQFETYTVPFDGAYAEGTYLATLQAEGPMYLWTHQFLDGITCYRSGEEYVYGTFKASYLRDPSASVKNSEKDYDESAQINTEQVVPTYGMGPNEDGTVNFQLMNYYSAGQKFTVKGGKFTGLVLDDAVVEGDDAELTVWVYKWDTDYATTIGGTPQYYGVSLLPMWDGGEHVDSYIRFDRAFAEGDYLVVLEADGPCSVWSHGLLDGVVTFFDEEEYTTATMKIAYIMDPEAELDERPVETPTPAPSQEPTPVISSTPAAKPTPTASPTGKPQEKQEDGSVPIVLWIALGVVAAGGIAAAVILLVKKKNRKA